MNNHYLVSIQPVDADGTPTSRAPLSFHVTNHDDLFAILEKVRPATAVSPAETAEFVVGLKLFLEVVHRHRKDPLFQEIWPNMLDFMKRLKSKIVLEKPL
jgi:hypothetical protein